MGPSTVWAHETVFPAEPASASRARDFVILHLLAHGLPNLVEDIRLVVSELSTNAMLHANTPFTVLLEAVGASVVLTVSDGTSEPPVPAAVSALASSGRGLSIVRAVSDDWGVVPQHNGNKSIWASFVIRPKLVGA